MTWTSLLLYKECLTFRWLLLVNYGVHEHLFPRAFIVVFISTIAMHYILWARTSYWCSSVWPDLDTLHVVIFGNQMSHSYRFWDFRLALGDNYSESEQISDPIHFTQFTTTSVTFVVNLFMAILVNELSG